MTSSRLQAPSYLAPDTQSQACTPASLMIHNHTPTTSMEKIQSQPKISRKKLEKKMRKIFHKKIGVLSEMCISDNTPNRYSKSRRHPKIRRRNGRPILISDDHSLSAPKTPTPPQVSSSSLAEKKTPKISEVADKTTRARVPFVPRTERVHRTRPRKSARPVSYFFH